MREKKGEREGPKKERRKNPILHFCFKQQNNRSIYPFLGISGFSGDWRGCRLFFDRFFLEVGKEMGRLA